MDALAVQAQATIDRFVPQNISNVLIAYVKLEESCPPALVDALVAAAQRHLHDFSPQVGWPPARVDVQRSTTCTSFEPQCVRPGQPQGAQGSLAAAAQRHKRMLTPR